MNSAAPKVTIAIPTYDRKDYLEQCIRSVLNQTFPNFEIIVFDNGSNYNIKDMLLNLGDGRISLNRIEKNIGAFENVARAFRYTYNTPYVMVFHDDDYLHPQALEISLKALEANPQSAFAASLLHFVSNPEKMDFFSVRDLKESQFKFYDSVDFIRSILKNTNWCFSSVLYRSEKLIDFAGLKYLGKWSDRAFLVEISKNGGMAGVWEKLANYRIHLGQDSKKNPEQVSEFLDKSQKLFEYYLSNLPKPLTLKDCYLFYRFTSNNLLLSAGGISQGWKEYLRLLGHFKKLGFFRFWSLNLRGVYYFAKTVVKFI
jgi:glycosyltransferase involved in cell wall biosynthesis